MLGLGNAVMCGQKAASGGGGTVKALFHFENNLTDSSGNGRTLTFLTGGSSYSTGSNILVGTASLQTKIPVGGYVGANLNLSSNIIIANSKAFTLDFLIKTEGGGNTFYIQINSLTYLQINAGGDIEFGDSYGYFPTAQSGVFLNTVRFVRIVYTLTQFKVYIGGILYATFDSVLTPEAVSLILYMTVLGAANSNLAVIFDEFRVTEGALDGTIVPSLPLTTTP